METISNLTSAASKAIWGEDPAEKTENNETAGKEPLSGETGDVKAGEPYDMGNAATATSTDPTSTSTDPKSGIPDTALTTSLPIRTEHETDKAGALDPTSTTISEPLTSSAAEPTSTSSSSGEKLNAANDEIVNTTKIAPLSSESGTVGGESTSTGIGGQDDIPQKEIPATGTETGAQTTTAPAATDGNWDASQAGTGKEAGSSSTPEPKEKKSLKEKIKAKLHRDKD